MEAITASIDVHDLSMSNIEIMLDTVFHDERAIPQVRLKIWTRDNGKKYVTVSVRSSKDPKRSVYGVKFSIYDITYYGEEIKREEVLNTWLSRWEMIFPDIIVKEVVN